MEPLERKGRREPAQSLLNTSPLSFECQRQLELLCAIVRSLTVLGDKLDDLAVLSQQQTDLLRRIVKERAL